MAFNSSSSYVFTENHPAEGYAGNGQVVDHAESRGRPFYTQAVVPHSASVSGASACHDSEHPLFTRAEGELEITASTHSRVSPLMDPYHPNQDSQSQDPGDWPAYPPLDLPAEQAPFERHAATSTSFEHSFHHQNPSQNPTFSQQHDQNHPPQQQPQPHQPHRLPFSLTPSHSQSQHHAQSHLGSSTGNAYANTSSSAQSYHAPRSSNGSHSTNTPTGYDSFSTSEFQPQLGGPSGSRSQYSPQYESQYTPPPSRLISQPMGTSLQHHQQLQRQIYDFADEQQPPPQRLGTGTTRLTSAPGGMNMSMHGARLGSGSGMAVGMGVSSMRTASPPRRGHGHRQGYAPSQPGSNSHPHSLSGPHPHQHHLDTGVGSSSNSLLTSVASHNPHLSNLGSQRFPLSFAGSLDPATGIFYRSPEHPRLRTAQACEKCRTRKAKCSGEHPACKRCITRGLVCEYAKEGRVRGPNKPKNQSQNQRQQAKNGAGGAAGASSSITGDAPSGSGADGESGGGAPERTDTAVDMSTNEAQYQQQDIQEQGTSPDAAGGAGRRESSVPPARRRHAAAAAASTSLQGFRSTLHQRQEDSSTPSSQGSVAGVPGEHRAALSSRRSYSQFGQPQPIALGMGLLSTNIPAPVPHPLESPAAFGLGPVTRVVSTFTDDSSASPSPYSYTFPGAGVGAPSSSSSIHASSMPSSLSSSASSNVSSMSTSSVTIAQRRGVSPHTHALGLGQGPGLRGTSGVGSVQQAPQTRLAAHIPTSSVYPYSLPSRTVSHAHAESIAQGGTSHGHENMSASAYMHSTQEQVFQPVFDARGTYHQQSQYEQQQQSLSYHEQLGGSSAYQQQENPVHDAYMRYQDESQHQHGPQGQYDGASDSNDTHPYGADDDGSRTTRIPQYPFNNAPGQSIVQEEHCNSSGSDGDKNDRGAQSTNAAFHPAPSQPPPPLGFLSGSSVEYSHDISVSPIPAPATYLYAGSSLAMSSTPTPSMPMSMPSMMMPPDTGAPQQQQIMPAAAPSDVDDDRRERAIDLLNERNPSRTPGGAREDVPVQAQSRVDDSGRYTPQELHYTYHMGQQQQSRQQRYLVDERRRSTLEFFQPQTPSDAQRSQQLQHLQDTEARLQSATEGDIEGGIAPVAIAVPQRDVDMVLDDVECPPPIHLPPPPMVQAMIHDPKGGTDEAGADAGATMGNRVNNPDTLAGAAESGGGRVSSVVDAGSVDAQGPGVGGLLSASDAETAQRTATNAPHALSQAPP